MGLSIVYGIVKQNKGEILVYSQVGYGTSIKIFFPKINNPEDDISLPKTYSSYELKGNETVLVVEDEEYILRSIQKIIKSYGYTILEAKDPETALQISRNYTKKINLMITDIIMPIMNGKELSKIIQKDHPDTQVLFISGYSEKVIDLKGILEEGIEFLQKPFSPIELVSKIKQILTKN